MKKMILITVTIIMFIIIVFLVIGITNKTYFKKYYEVTNLDGKEIRIPLPLLSYYKGENTFSTLRSVKSVSNILNKYVENLQSCYDESYFYDKDLNITINRYYVENEFPFNKINLEYSFGNRCENEFVLDDNWVDEIIEESEIEEISIRKCVSESDVLKCDSKTINEVDIEEVLQYTMEHDFVRIKNNKNIGIDETGKHYLISIYYKIGKSGYMLSIFKHDDNYLAFKVTDANDHGKNAIYDINKDIDTMFNDIYNKY